MYVKTITAAVQYPPDFAEQSTVCDPAEHLKMEPSQPVCR